MLPGSPHPLVGIVENRERLLAVGDQELVVLLDDLNDGGLPPLPRPGPVVDVDAVQETAVGSPREDGFFVQDPKESAAIVMEVYRSTTTLKMRKRSGI